MTFSRLAALAALTVLGAAPAGAQSDATTEFIVRRGKDTLAIERFSRDAATLTGNIAQSNGGKFEYVANLRGDNTVEHVELQRTAPNGNSATMSVDFADTLVKATVMSGAQTQSLSVGTLQKPLPFLLISFALCEQIVKASHPEVGKPVKWMAVRLGAGDTASMTVTRVSADSVTISVPQGDVRLAVSAAGDVVGGQFPPQQILVERKKATAP